MLTPSEYIANPLPKDGVLWVHGLDIVKHCLQGDVEQSFFKDNRPAKTHFSEWQNDMQDRAEVQDGFVETYENAYEYKDMYQTVFDDEGELDIESYICNEDMIFTDEVLKNAPGPSCSVLLDCTIPYTDRENTTMQDWHQKCYDIVARCDSENRPVQVVGLIGIKISEHPTPLTIAIAIKGYNDPIFPSIWGALKTNKSANNFLNVVMDFFIGTRSTGNGNCRVCENVTNLFPEQEELIIFGKRIKA